MTRYHWAVVLAVTGLMCQVAAWWADSRIQWERVWVLDGEGDWNPFEPGREPVGWLTPRLQGFADVVEGEKGAPDAYPLCAYSEPCGASEGVEGYWETGMCNKCALGPLIALCLPGGCDSNGVGCEPFECALCPSRDGVPVCPWWWASAP